MSALGDPIGELAEGLWRRLRDVLLAERRLESFTFAPETEGARAASPGRLAALAADDSAIADLARDLTLRALAAATDGVNYRVLACLGSEPVGLDAVARALGLPPLAVSERVHALAQLGLASRTLEQDGVGETVAGRGLVRLVETLGGELAARCRAGVGSL